MKLINTTIVVTFVVVWSIIHSANVSATVIYTYQGVNYNNSDITDAPETEGTYDTSMAISGWFSTADFLPHAATNVTPLDYSFTDGRNIFDPTNT